MAKPIRFEEFRPGEDWLSYHERLFYCFAASNITDPTLQRANFYAVCGASTFRVLTSLISPRKSYEVTINEVIDILSSHFDPRPNEITQSFKFYNRNQGATEKVIDYIAELRRISSDCHFGAFLDRMLRDRIVCGMSDKTIQRQLLQRATLTYADVVNAAIAAETAGNDMRVINEYSIVGASAVSAAHGTATASSSEEAEMDINKLYSSATSRGMCFRCGNSHAGECKVKHLTCRYCHKSGHIERICQKKKKDIAQQHGAGERMNEVGRVDSLFHVMDNTKIKAVSPPYTILVTMNNKHHQFELDTGATFTIISVKAYMTIWGVENRPQLQETDIKLKSWTGNTVQLAGEISVRVKYRGSDTVLPLLVANSDGPSLLGRNWLEPLHIYIHGIHSVNLKPNYCEEITQKYPAVFQQSLGKYNGPAISISPNNIKPIHLKHRSVPYALKEKVEEEIDRLTTEGVLKPITYSEWATPIVTIVKRSGGIRICGDYRSTVNKATDADTYPLPTNNDIFANLTGGKYFSKLDLEQAYTQVEVDEETAKLLTWNTTKGLFTVHRLPFGVKAATGIFQRLMTQLLMGIKGTQVLLDDILISGRTIEEHDERLDAVLQRLAGAGLKLNKTKCEFLLQEVNFLGFTITADGISPNQNKVSSILNTPRPSTVKELQAFLGLYNFYERFIPNKATILEPLHRLLDKKCTWKWSSVEEAAFNEAKSLLISEKVLVHFDVHRDITLTCDASAHGIGATLAHVMDDGSERPIAVASRTLNKHERNYSVLDKEATAIMFGLTKFHNYVTAKKVVIFTDHKPLLGIFGTTKPIPLLLSPRMTRWALQLSSFDYELKYKKGEHIGNADALSRWPEPVNNEDDEEDICADVLLMTAQPDDPDFNIEKIAEQIEKDPTLSKVMDWIRRGWPQKVTDTTLRSYWLKRAEMSTMKNCILMGNRVVIPEKMRNDVLKLLHDSHNGIVVTKGVARSYVWWPHITEDIEKMISSCETCQNHRHLPPKVYSTWPPSSKPWSRLHVDFAGPYMGKMFFIAVDSFSKWPEVRIVPNTSATVGAQALREIFSNQGLCETLVSDNASLFTSAEFLEFCNKNKIKHILVPPYHPASNGQAERYVQTVKEKLSKLSNVPWNLRLPRLLYAMRTTPKAGTDKTPAEILNGRCYRTILDSIHPQLQPDTQDMENTNVKTSSRRSRRFKEGEQVRYRLYANKNTKWDCGQIHKKLSFYRFQIKTRDGKIIQRHLNQIIRNSVEEAEGEEMREIRNILGIPKGAVVKLNRHAF